MKQVILDSNFSSTKKAKHIFFDLDGTVINKTHTISPQVLDAFKKLKEKKVPYSIASGRAPFQCHHIVKELEINEYCSFLSGGIVMNPATNEVLAANYFNPERLKLIKEFFDLQNIYYEFYYSDGYRISKEDQRHEIHMTYGHQLPISKQILDNDLEGVLKITMLLLDDNDWVLHKNLIKNFPELGEKVGLGSKHSDVGFANITCTNNALDSAYQQLLNYYQLKAEDILAIGDANSDYNFVKSSGFGVAMGNAVPELKEVAKYITEHVEDDGAALAFNKLC